METDCPSWLTMVSASLAPIWKMMWLRALPHNAARISPGICSVNWLAMMRWVRYLRATGAPSRSKSRTGERGVAKPDRRSRVGKAEPRSIGATQFATCCEQLKKSAGNGWWSRAEKTHAASEWGDHGILADDVNRRPCNCRQVSRNSLSPTMRFHSSTSC